MKLSTLIFCLASIVCLQAASQEKVVVIIPSMEQEIDYIWRNLQDIPFFDEHGYQVSLPESDLMETLQEKSRKGKLVSSDRDELETLMKEIYDASDYQAGYDKVTQNMGLINGSVSELVERKHNWDFQLFDTYEVFLTLYGTGGSYDPEDGSIILFTNTEGAFRQYDNPAYTIIHEIVHIGIEESIIAKFNLPHPMKERIVDTYVSISFGDKLPGYRIQNMGDPAIDEYIQSESELINLEKVVVGFLEEQN